MSDKNDDKNIDQLREHLFATLEGLRSKDAPLEIERAKAICDVAQVIVNTAKVEVDYLRVAGGKVVSSKFIGHEKLPAGINGVMRHRLVG